MDYLIFSVTSTKLIAKSCRNAAQIHCFCIELPAREFCGGSCFSSVFFSFSSFFTAVTPQKYY